MKHLPTAATCLTCESWLKIANTTGECHQGPPQATDGADGARWQFPTTFEDDWCAQWEPDRFITAQTALQNAQANMERFKTSAQQKAAERAHLPYDAMGDYSKKKGQE